jgi:hypothetical protein
MAFDQIMHSMACNQQGQGDRQHQRHRSLTLQPEKCTFRAASLKHIGQWIWHWHERLTFAFEGEDVAC